MSCLSLRNVLTSGRVAADGTFDVYGEFGEHAVLDFEATYNIQTLQCTAATTAALLLYISSLDRSQRISVLIVAGFDIGHRRDRRRG